MKNLFYLLCWPLSYLFYVMNRKPLRVLAYHKVTDPKHFEEQLIFLKKKFKILSIQELERLMMDGKNPPEHSVVITFDDGDVSLKKNAIDLLKKYDTKAMVFIITELIDSKLPFWWDHVSHSYGKEKYADGRKEVNRLKKVSNADRMSRLNDVRREVALEADQLTVGELRELEAKGLAIGNHSHTHPMFDRSTNEEIMNEFRAAKTFFDSHGLQGYRYFVYPNGNADDRTESRLKEAGIGMAFLFDHRLNTTINPLRISRLKVNDYLTLPEFFAKVSGFHSFLMNLRA